MSINNPDIWFTSILKIIHYSLAMLPGMTFTKSIFKHLKNQLLAFYEFSRLETIFLNFGTKDISNLIVYLRCDLRIS